MDCHQANGAGAPPHYPPLANNVAITLPQSTNAIRLILNGSYPPSITGNPYPYGMPPFGSRLSDTEIAALLSYMRQKWVTKLGLLMRSRFDANAWRQLSN